MISKDIYYISFVRLVLAFAYAISYLYIPIYLYENIHLSSSFIGTIMGISTLLGLAGWIPASYLIQKLGEKKLMIYSLFIRSIIFLLISLIIYYNLSYFLLILLLFINSFLLGISDSPIETYLLNQTDHSNRNIAISVYRTGMNLGWAFGPYLGGILFQKNFSLPFIISSLLIFIIIFVIHKILKFESSIKIKNKWTIMKSYRLYYKNIKFLWYIINSLNLFITMSLLITPLSIFLSNYPNFSNIDLGKLYLVNGLMVVFFQISLSLWIKNVFLSIQIGLLFYFFGFFSIGIFVHFNMFSYLIFSIIIITIGEILAVSSVYTVATFFYKNQNLTQFNSNISSIMGFIRSLGWSIGPIIAGFIQDIFKNEPISIWFFSSLFAIIGLVVYSIIFSYFKA